MNRGEGNGKLTGSFPQRDLSHGINKFRNIQLSVIRYLSRPDTIFGNSLRK